MTSLVHLFRTALSTIGLVVLSSLGADPAASPSITSGSSFPTDDEPDGSLHLRTGGLDGALLRMGDSWDPVTSVPAGRIFLDWQAGARGKPGLNADPDFEILGTNATSASCTYWAEGGITLTTAGASADQVILAPHLDANQSAWSRFTWGTDKATVWETTIWTSASVATMLIWVGLKLTNTPTIATDANQAYALYNAATDAFWHGITSIADVDTNTVSTVTVAVSTQYRVRIEISPTTRIAKIYINGVLVVTTAALTDAIDLIPYIGIQASAAAAVSINVQRQRIGRNAG